MRLLELELGGILDRDDRARPPGSNAESAFRSVVLPVPVPPEMSTLSLPSTHASRKLAAFSVSEPNSIRSSIVYGSRENLRIVRVGPLSESGGMIALTRLPSGRRASTIGDASSTRRPTWETIFSMIRSEMRVVDERRRSVLSIFPERST